ncbi:MAG TPA: glycosyltransferase [Candidatus Methylomirabilis sp.]|nr:glycosyltransferase [Candidatus Methylomirabilis sp.]
MSDKRPKRLILHATNVHHGGGRILLQAVLRAAANYLPTIAFLDSRLDLPVELQQGVEIRRIAPRITSRLRGEWELARTTRMDDLVLCFGNLPPLFRCRGTVYVLIQNRYAVEPVRLEGLSAWVRLRTWIERLWLQLGATHAHGFVVQTALMERLLRSRLGEQTPIMTAAFAGRPQAYQRRLAAAPRRESVKYDFLYVASGEAHKNHRNLVEAWRLLAAEDLRPVLCLTVSPRHHAALCQWIEQVGTQHRLRIINLGTIPDGEIGALYGQAGALVYPSLFESLGLPLIEARWAGLPILAAELDYVRELIDPEESFDPDSPLSIARAVKRYLGVESHALGLLDASGLLQRLGGAGEPPELSRGATGASR